jgi:hypothetical protein
MGALRTFCSEVLFMGKVTCQNVSATMHPLVPLTLPLWCGLEWTWIRSTNGRAMSKVWNCTSRERQNWQRVSTVIHHRRMSITDLHKEDTLAESTDWLYIDIY